MGSTSVNKDQDTPPLQSLQPFNIQGMYAKNLPATKVESLLSGVEAVALLADPEVSDMILQPSQGEFILANSSYLKRNVFFVNVLVSTHTDHIKTNPLEVHPPYPTEFRSSIACIYANSEDYVLNKLGSCNFGPVLMNARYFQDETTIAACILWFSGNWSTVLSKSSTFNCLYIDQTMLEKLVDTVDEDNNKRLELLFKYANCWYENGDGAGGSKTTVAALREFIADNVDCGGITDGEWLRFVSEYFVGVGICVSKKHRNEFFEKVEDAVKDLKYVVKLKLKCQKCGKCVASDSFGDPKVLCSMRRGLRYESGYNRVSASDMHELDGVSICLEAGGN
ncbi:UNVERIFIED_CONTAM: hypothetical protein HDU68_008962 [Siphonaria sp. JEL0065]|nr:hypothetical protein HDU68_008962 [Siphonaria sp. JEL0065]